MKAKFLALAALVLGLASCQAEPEGFDVVVGGEQEVTINVTLPEATRTTNAASNVGGLSFFDAANYDIRYILEIYQDGDRIKTRDVKTSDSGSVAFPVRLVPGRDYTFVVWADFVNDGSNDLHYNTEGGLTDIKFQGVWTAMDETRDAYTEVLDVEDFSGSSNINMTLTRPFAKLRVVTTDIAELTAISNLPTAVQRVDYSVDVCTGFNALTQKAQNEENAFKSFGRYNLPGAYTDEEGEMTLFTDYLFGPADGTIQFVVETLLADGETVVNTFNTEIPVERNKVTTIIGDLLTDANNVKVEIENGFEQPENTVDVWDGVSVTEPEVETDTTTGETVAVIDSASDLAWLAGYVNGTLTSTFATRAATSVNFVLAADIDLNNKYWTGIGTEENYFTGTFDGNGHTIKNLSIIETEAKEGKAYVGFFGYAKNATIKNVTFENVNINIPCLDIDHSQGHIGAVAGSLEGTSTIENVTVKGDIKIEATVTANGASRVAVVAGGNSYGNVTMKNVHVIANEGSYLKANNNVGALAGQLQGKSVFEDCSSNIDVTGTKFFAGGIIGIAAGDQLFTNCHTTGNIAITAGREGRAHDQFRVGGIAGGWGDGKNNVCTLVNCSYTGTISGKNADGSVTEAFDYAGYVGRGYTLTNCAGSKVVIDDVEYVQVYNNATQAGVYYVNGMYEVNSAADLKILAADVNGGNPRAGETVILTAHIDLNNEEWTPIGSAYTDHGFMANFDGNGFVIKNLKMTAITPDSDNYVYAGLFGVTEGSETARNYIKNLTIENVNINLNGHIVAAAVAYPYYTDIENVVVKGNISIKGSNYTAGILAYTRRCVNVKNISIVGNEGSVIEGNMTIGGVISDLQTNGGLIANYSNFAASGLTIKGVRNVGGITGIIGGQTLDGATVNNVTIECGDPRTGIVAGALGSESHLENVSYENVTGATRVIGATWDTGNYVGQIVEVADQKAVIFTIENGVKAVSVAEQNLKGMYWQDAIDWAANLGEGWALASMEDLNAIYDLRCELNDVLEADSADNALFWEGDELYIKNGSVYYALYMSRDEIPVGGADANGNKYFENRVFFKIFNKLGYSDVLYSAFDCINKYAPLRDNHFARAVYTL